MNDLLTCGLIYLLIDLLTDCNRTIQSASQIASQSLM